MFTEVYVFHPFRRIVFDRYLTATWHVRSLWVADDTFHVRSIHNWGPKSDKLRMGVHSNPYSIPVSSIQQMNAQLPRDTTGFLGGQRLADVALKLRNAGYTGVSSERSRLPESFPPSMCVASLSSIFKLC